MLKRIHVCVLMSCPLIRLRVVLLVTSLIILITLQNSANLVKRTLSIILRRMNVWDVRHKIQFWSIRSVQYVLETILILMNQSKIVNNVHIIKYITDKQKNVNVHLKRSISQDMNVWHVSTLSFLIISTVYVNSAQISKYTMFRLKNVLIVLNNIHYLMVRSVKLVPQPNTSTVLL